MVRTVRTGWYDEAIAAPNPFVVDRPLPPEDLIDREREAARLLELARGSHNARVSAPRRYGKTTLLGKLELDAQREGMATAFVDFYGVVSLEEVALRIEEAYRRSLQGALARWFTGFVRTWGPGFRAGAPGASLSLEPRPEAEAVRLLQQLLDLPLAIFDRSGRRTLVIFDEFQALLAASDTIDGLIRSRIQRHGDVASYVFAGSHPGLMTELFGERARPLYGQARPVELGPLPDDALAEYIGSRFEETGRDTGVALEPLLELARGHPQRAMLLAHHLWDETPRGQAADERNWTRALEAVFAELREAFERAWEDLSANQRRVLAAVASAGGAFYAAETLRHFRLAKGTARDVRRALVRQGDLEEVEGGRVRFVDPLFEAWVASGRRGLSAVS